MSLKKNTHFFPEGYNTSISKSLSIPFLKYLIYISFRCKIYYFKNAYCNYTRRAQTFKPLFKLRKKNDFDPMT